MDPVCCCDRCGGACGRLATVMEGGRALCELCRIEIKNQCGWQATRKEQAMCETETTPASEAFDTLAGDVNTDIEPEDLFERVWGGTLEDEISEIDESGGWDETRGEGDDCARWWTGEVDGLWVLISTGGGGLTECGFYSSEELAMAAMTTQISEAFPDEIVVDYCGGCGEEDRSGWTYCGGGGIECGDRCPECGIHRHDTEARR